MPRLQVCGTGRTTRPLRAPRGPLRPRSRVVLRSRGEGLCALRRGRRGSSMQQRNNLQTRRMPRRRHRSQFALRRQCARRSELRRRARPDVPYPRQMHPRSMPPSQRGGVLLRDCPQASPRSTRLPSSARAGVATSYPASCSGARAASKRSEPPWRSWQVEHNVGRPAAHQRRCGLLQRARDRVVRVQKR